MKQKEDKRVGITMGRNKAKNMENIFCYSVFQSQKTIPSIAWGLEYVLLSGAAEQTNHWSLWIGIVN